MKRTIDTTFLPPVGWLAGRLREIDGDPLRRAVVLTSSERLAHALRRHVCVELQAPELLAGVSLLRPAAFARELLLAAGDVSIEGWEPLRRLRLISLFLSGALDRQLRYFKADQLSSSPGYAEAFAATIGDLEASGLDPSLTAAAAEQLRADDPQAADRLHDLAVVWERIDQERNDRSTTAGALQAAAARLVAGPELADPHGPVLVALTRSPSTALLRFLDQLPDCSMVIQEARPWRTGAQRWRDRVVLAIPDEREVQQAAEIDLLRRYLFELPENLTDSRRPRSHGPDGSVRLEQYAGIEEEIEAAANWTAEQIMSGIALERIALVVPELKAYAAELSDRLQRLQIDSASLAVHIAGGVGLGSSPAGLRLTALIEALAKSLDAPAVIRLLPMLRRPGQGSDAVSSRLSPSRAARLIYGAGIVGGSPRDPRGLTEWVPRLSARRDHMKAQLEHSEAALEAAGADRLEARRLKMEASAARQWLRDMEPLLPAIAALQRLGEAVANATPLAILWPDLVSFCERHLLLPPHPPGLLAMYKQRLAPIMGDAVAREIRGRTAIQFLASILATEPMAVNRFGCAAVFIGTAAHAAGLPFDAVRILGLTEGGIPRTPHDDPIIPDDLRQNLESVVARCERDGIVIPRQADRVLDDIHDVFRVVQGAAVRLALSSPRQWIDRSDRELSGIVLEVATALGRQAGIDGEGDVPTAARLRAAYFDPDVEQARAAAMTAARTPRSLFANVVASVRHSPTALRVPSSWAAAPKAFAKGQAPDEATAGALSVVRLHSLLHDNTAPALRPMDGDLHSAWTSHVPPGIGERPISASALGVLLRCPHRFMLERVLHFQEPFRVPSSDSIDPVNYGELLHAIAAAFFQTAGADLCQRARSADELIDEVRPLAEEAFDRLCRTYPLRGADSFERERERLLRQLEYLVRDEWQRPKREFVAAELGFGQKQLVRVGNEGGGLNVWGAIDRVDRLPEGLSVRDIKTGRVHDFIEEPVNVGRDLQLGLYVLALELSEPYMDRERVVEASYVHPSVAQEPERGFVGAELDILRARTRDWLRVAEVLLRGGHFVRTSSPDDCRVCPFQPTCGDEAAVLSAGKLRQLPAAHELELFVRLKAERGTER